MVSIIFPSIVLAKSPLISTLHFKIWANRLDWLIDDAVGPRRFFHQIHRLLHLLLKLTLLSHLWFSHFYHVVSILKTHVGEIPASVSRTRCSSVSISSNDLCGSHSSSRLSASNADELSVVDCICNSSAALGDIVLTTAFNLVDELCRSPHLLFMDSNWFL